MKMKNSHKREIAYALGMMTQLGLTMIIPILGCLLLGKFLDDRLGSSPWFLIVMIVFGVACAFRNLFVLSMRGFEKKK